MADSSKSSHLRSKLFVSSLALASYAEQNLDILVGLLLIDIAATFNVTPGFASQVVTLSKIAAIAAGLVIGTLSVRFRYKSLLVAGILAIIVGMLGSMLAPNLIALQIFYPLDGVGTVIITAMAATLIGTLLPTDRRPRALAWLLAAASLCWVIGTPLIGMIAGMAGWRATLAAIMIPISLVSLLMVLLFVPSPPKASTIGKTHKAAYIISFKRVLKNKSAVSCLIAVALIAFLQSWVVYVGTFYRTNPNFSVSIELTSVILLGASLFLALGGLIGSRIIKNIGRKNLLVTGTIIRSITIASLVFIPFFWLVLIIDFANTLFGGISFNALSSLNVEQVPESRGTMMALAGVFSALGAALGVAVGGPVLDILGLQFLAPMFAVAGISSAIIVYLFARDPCGKNALTSNV